MTVILLHAVTTVVTASAGIHTAVCLGTSS